MPSHGCISAWNAGRVVALVCLTVAWTVASGATTPRPSRGPPGASSKPKKCSEYREWMLPEPHAAEARDDGEGRNSSTADYHPSVNLSTSPSDQSYANHKSFNTLVFVLLATLSVFVLFMTLCIVLIILHEKGCFAWCRWRTSSQPTQSEPQNTASTATVAVAPTRSVAEPLTSVETNPPNELQALIQEAARHPRGNAARNQRIEELIISSLSHHERVLVDAMVPDDRIGWVRHWRRRLVHEERMLQRQQSEEHAVQLQPGDVHGVNSSVVDGYLVVDRSTIGDLATRLHGSEPCASWREAPSELQLRRGSASDMLVGGRAHRCEREDHGCSSGGRKPQCPDWCDADGYCEDARKCSGSRKDGTDVVMLVNCGAFTEVEQTPGTNSEHIRLYRRAPSEFVYGRGSAYVSHQQAASPGTAGEAPATEDSAGARLASAPFNAETLLREADPADAATPLERHSPTGVPTAHEQPHDPSVGPSHSSCGRALPPTGVIDGAFSELLPQALTAGPQDAVHVRPPHAPQRSSSPPLLSAENFIALVPTGTERLERRDRLQDPSTSLPSSQDGL